MSEKDFETQGLVYKATFRASIDFREWNKNRMSRWAAFKAMLINLDYWNFRWAWHYAKVVWRGWWRGTIVNHGA